MKRKLKAFAASLGITETGVTTYGGRTAFVCLFPYFAGKEEGNLSVYAYSRDYHAIIREKLAHICDFLLTDCGAAYAEGFADIGPAVDKSLAYCAGLGFYGRNTLMINPRLGSFFFIGYVLTDLPMESDKPLGGKCLGCGRCAEACPGKALDEGFHAERCASALTQKKGPLTEDEREIIRRSGCVFGCDICQLVCPHNSAPPQPMPEFLKDRICNLTHDMLKGLSNREFRDKFGGRAFAWRGKAVLLRNLDILEK